MRSTPPADAPSRSRTVSQKHVAELRDLHNEVAAAAEGVKRWSNTRARRRLREAKVAEADLLRALGFVDWFAFEDHVRRYPGLSDPADVDGSGAVDLDLVAEHAADDSARFEPAGSGPFHLGANTPVGEAEQLAGLLAETRAQLVALHVSVSELNDQLERVLMETVALRLELMVAERHRAMG